MEYTDYHKHCLPCFPLLVLPLAFPTYHFYHFRILLGVLGPSYSLLLLPLLLLLSHSPLHPESRLSSQMPSLTRGELSFNITLEDVINHAWVMLITLGGTIGLPGASLTSRTLSSLLTLLLGFINRPFFELFCISKTHV